jgi:hypothetical protein
MQAEVTSSIAPHKVPMKGFGSMEATIAPGRLAETVCRFAREDFAASHPGHPRKRTPAHKVPGWGCTTKDVAARLRLVRP